MKQMILLLAAALATQTAACEGGTSEIRTTRASPTARLPLAPGRPGVAYLELDVQGDRVALLSVASPRIGRIEMHESMSSGGMSSMRPISRIPVRNGEDVRFVPGGRHLMLFEMDPALRPGDSVELNFRFERGQPERVVATVIAANDGADHH